VSILTLLLIALGVSADAFAVAIGKGLSMRTFHARTALILAVCFGAAQALMPLLGWLLGTQLEQLITEVDHWIAFGLLAAVGAKMLHEALADAEGEDPGSSAGTDRTTTLIAPKELVVLSVATSIDALAVGISLAFIDVSITQAVLLIGSVTFLLTFAGVAVGQRVGAQFRKPAEVAGGLVLIGIGVKILFDHLGVL
jgi:putative Mn2+ efflux pump MntP